MGKKWSQSEICLLVNGRFVPNRTPSAINNMKGRLGIRTKRGHRPKWTDAEIEKLKEFRKRGLSARSIFKMGLLNQSTNAIQKQMCRMGLAKRMKVFKFSPALKEKFKKFLAEKWEGKTPKNLVEMWNKENAGYPTNKRKVVYYLTRLGIKIPYGEVQRINSLRRKIEEIHNSFGSSAQTLERIRLARTAVMKKRAEKGRDIWTGLPVPAEETQLEDSLCTS